MTDLLSQENVDQFRQALRSVTDTFHKTPVTLRRESGEEIDLLSGKKSDDVGSYGEVNGERYTQDDRQETVERWIVSFNRDYLLEKDLIDEDDGLLITQEDWIILEGKRYAIVKIQDKAIFRGVPILVNVTVQR